MTESQYLRATNRAKISMALTIIRDVLPGEDYGITEADAAKIKKLLAQAEEKLFSSYEIKERDDSNN